MWASVSLFCVCTVNTAGCLAFWRSGRSSLLPTKQIWSGNGSSKRQVFDADYFSHQKGIASREYILLETGKGFCYMDRKRLDLLRWAQSYIRHMYLHDRRDFPKKLPTLCLYCNFYIVINIKKVCIVYYPSQYFSRCKNMFQVKLHTSKSVMHSSCMSATQTGMSLANECECHPYEYGEYECHADEYEYHAKRPCMGWIILKPVLFWIQALEGFWDKIYSLGFEIGLCKMHVRYKN